MAFEFHYRFNDQGGCDVICTRCFQNVGHAPGPEMMQRLTASHVCDPGTAHPTSHSPTWQNDTRAALRRLVRVYHKVETSTRLLIVGTVLLFYVLPTVFETQISHNPGQWVACVLSGDLAGCMGIYFILKRHQAAVLLYLILTCLEASLCSMRAIALPNLVWSMDIVPTIFFATQIAQWKPKSSPPQAI